MSHHHRPNHRAMAPHGEFGRDVVVAGKRLSPDEAALGVGALATAGAWVLGISTGWSLAAGLAGWFFTKNKLDKP